MCFFWCGLEPPKSNRNILFTSKMMVCNMGFVFQTMASFWVSMLDFRGGILPSFVGIIVNRIPIKPPLGNAHILNSKMEVDER